MVGCGFFVKRPRWVLANAARHQGSKSLLESVTNADSFRTSVVRRTNQPAPYECHAYCITYCFISNLLTLCNAQKTLDIRCDHPKMGTIAAMHNTS
jgi:hypothetical protein